MCTGSTLIGGNGRLLVLVGGVCSGSGDVPTPGGEGEGDGAGLTSEGDGVGVGATVDGATVDGVMVDGVEEEKSSSSSDLIVLPQLNDKEEEKEGGGVETEERKSSCKEPDVLDPEAEQWRQMLAESVQREQRIIIGDVTAGKFGWGRIRERSGLEVEQVMREGLLGGEASAMRYLQLIDGHVGERGRERLQPSGRVLSMEETRLAVRVRRAAENVAAFAWAKRKKASSPLAARGVRE